MRIEKSQKTATAWMLAVALVVGLPQLAAPRPCCASA